MPPSMKVLIIGAGVGGMSTAIALRKNGIAVDIIDSDPKWGALGAGLTITGPTLRAFKWLGVIDDIAREGAFSPTVRLFTAGGQPIGALEQPTLEPGIPAAGGILRPVLHKIMANAVRAADAQVRLGITVTALTQDADGVTVTFSDGATARYDAVVGADGYHSRTRAMIFPDAPKPQFTGQGCWRALADRPAGVTSAEIYFGPYKVGLNPCSPDKMYMFCTKAMPGNPAIANDELLPRMREILAPFAGNVTAVREQLGPDSLLNYRPLEALLLPRPWSKGRVGLIGDAVHATTPHLASGAGIAVEDALVLAEEFARTKDVPAAWRAFEQRRWERCRLVVEQSVHIGKLEQEGGHDADVARIMGEAARALAAPI